MSVAIILGLCFILFIYFGIAHAIFKFCAKNDFFEEIECWLRGEFPTKTFLVSVFWIIAIPLMLIAAGIGWVIEEIIIDYQVMMELGRQRKDK